MPIEVPEPEEMLEIKLILAAHDVEPSQELVECFYKWHSKKIDEAFEFDHGEKKN